MVYCFLSWRQNSLGMGIIWPPWSSSSLSVISLSISCQSSTWPCSASNSSLLAPGRVMPPQPSSSYSNSISDKSTSILPSCWGSLWRPSHLPRNYCLWLSLTIFSVRSWVRAYSCALLRAYLLFWSSGIIDLCESKRAAFDCRNWVFTARLDVLARYCCINLIRKIII